MNIMLLVPRVVQSYISRFPEVQRNAYPYFNYDNRVVDESVDRDDEKRPYKDADDFNDIEYDELVRYASQLIDPVLAKYSYRVAAEDALSLAIRDFKNGFFDGKVNANKYNVLLDSMSSMKFAKSEKKPKEKSKPKKVELKRPSTRTLKELGIRPSKVPLETKHREHMRRRSPGGFDIVKEKGKIVTKK